MAVARMRGQPTGSLEILDFGYVVFLVLVAVCVPAVRDVLAQWAARLSIAVVLAFCLASLARRRPFTMDYTVRDQREAQSPEFLRANMRLTWMWVIVLSIQLMSAVMAGWVVGSSNDPLFGWAIPIAVLTVGFVLNARMTRQMQDHGPQSETTPAPGSAP